MIKRHYLHAHLACVNAHSHIHILIGVSIELLDGGDHVEPHVDAAFRVIRAGFGASADGVVAIPEGVNLLASVPGTEFVEPPEKIVQQSHQMLCSLSKRTGEKRH